MVPAEYNSAIRQITNLRYPGEGFMESFNDSSIMHCDHEPEEGAWRPQNNNSALRGDGSWKLTHRLPYLESRIGIAE